MACGHSLAQCFEATNWPRIMRLCDALDALSRAGHPHLRAYCERHTARPSLTANRSAQGPKPTAA